MGERGGGEKGREGAGRKWCLYKLWILKIYKQHPWFYFHFFTEIWCLQHHFTISLTKQTWKTGILQNKSELPLFFYPEFKHRIITSTLLALRLYVQSLKCLPLLEMNPANHTGWKKRHFPFRYNTHSIKVSKKLKLKRTLFSI